MRCCVHVLCVHACLCVFVFVSTVCVHASLCAFVRLCMSLCSFVHLCVHVCCACVLVCLYLLVRWDLLFLSSFICLEPMQLAEECPDDHQKKLLRNYCEQAMIRAVAWLKFVRFAFNPCRDLLCCPLLGLPTWYSPPRALFVCLQTRHNSSGFVKDRHTKDEQKCVHQHSKES